MVKNWKTTVAGLFVFLMFNGEDLGISPRWQRILTGAGVALGFLSSKDKDVTGVGLNARRKGDGVV